MYEIPKPELLSPDRVGRDDREHFTADDHRPQSQLLAKALGESCAYADQLWEQLNALRGYLLDSLPPDPAIPGPHTTAGTAPSGPDDEDGWANWINAFAATTSVLCGSHGDSGFGLSRARQEAQLRRTATPLTPPVDRTEPAAPPPAADRPMTDSPAPSAVEPAPSNGDPGTTFFKAVAVGAIGVLALRGLRTSPRHRADRPRD